MNRELLNEYQRYFGTIEIPRIDIGVVPGVYHLFIRYDDTPVRDMLTQGDERNVRFETTNYDEFLKYLEQTKQNYDHR